MLFYSYVIINPFDIDIYILILLDLLFLDIDMPDLDGITLARQIKKGLYFCIG